MLWNLKDIENLNIKLNHTKVHAITDSIGKRFADATCVNSMNTSLILLKLLTQSCVLVAGR